MGRLRYGDWIGGIGAVCLLIVLSTYKSGWTSLGWFTVALNVVAVASMLGAIYVTITRDSPVGPLLGLTGALLLGFGATVANLVEGYWIGIVDAAILTAGAYLAMRDERAPGVPEPPVDLRPAPPAV